MSINKAVHLARTISVEGYHFSPLDLTKAEFAKRWMDHTSGLRRLSSSTDWQKSVDRMVSKTRTYACMEFETMYEDQNK